MELSNLQKKVGIFAKEKSINTKVETRIIDLVSEVGELSKEVLKGTSYGSKEFKVTQEWKSEIGDVLFSLICIANESNIDLNDSLMNVLNKYEERFKSKGHVGSNK